MSTNYNLIAPLYGIISKLVFGNSLINASAHFFGELPEEGNVLIVGGGNGRILKKLYLIKPNLKIVYCDNSQKMIDLSKKINPFRSEQCTFKCESAFDLQLSACDAVICPFFLDQFSNIDVLQFLNTCKSYTKESGVILFTDFNSKSSKNFKWVHKTLIKSMYFFFALTTGLKQRSLPDFENAFLNNGWKVYKNWNSKNGLIMSSVYRK